MEPRVTPKPGETRPRVVVETRKPFEVTRGGPFSRNPDTHRRFMPGPPSYEVHVWHDVNTSHPFIEGDRIDADDREWIVLGHGGDVLGPDERMVTYYVRPAS